MTATLWSMTVLQKNLDSIVHKPKSANKNLNYEGINNDFHVDK